MWETKEHKQNKTFIIIILFVLLQFREKTNIEVLNPEFSWIIYTSSLHHDHKTWKYSYTWGKLSNMIGYRIQYLVVLQW